MQVRVAGGARQEPEKTPEEISVPYGTVRRAHSRGCPFASRENGGLRTAVLGTSARQTGMRPDGNERRCRKDTEGRRSAAGGVRALPTQGKRAQAVNTDQGVPGCFGVLWGSSVVLWGFSSVSVQDLAPYPFRGVPGCSGVAPWCSRVSVQFQFKILLHIRSGVFPVLPG